MCAGLAAVCIGFGAAPAASDAVAAVGLPAQASAQAREVPTPPGIDGATLAPRSPTDPAAWLTLQELLTRQASRPGAGSAPDAAPEAPLGAAPAAPDAGAPPDIASEAGLRAYIRGREAAMAERWLVAISELEKARAAEPDSPAVLRELARAYGAMGNAARAAEEYRRLLELSPDDSEALLAVGVTLVNRRQSEEALGALLRLWGLAEADEQGLIRQAGPELRFVAAYALSIALRQTGHDRAANEVAVVAAAAPSPLELEGQGPHSAALRPRLGEVWRQRGETWRAIGDACCRLEDYEGAAEAYAQAAALDVADPAGLRARRAYAALRRGRSEEAARLWLSAVEAAPASVTAQDAAVAAWLLKALPSPAPLEEGMRRLAAQHAGEASLMRAAAAVLPPAEAVALLRAALAQRPDDLSLVGALLGELAEDRLELAAGLAVELAAEQPARTDAIAQRLATVRARPGAILAALESTPPRAARSAVYARLLTLWRDPGAAWAVCEQARKLWPDDPSVQATRLAVAGVLEEPSLLDEAAEELGDSVLASPVVGAAMAEARVRCGQAEQAFELAEALAGRHPQSALAQAAAAQAALAAAGLTASRAPDDVARWTREAQRFADAALDVDERNEDAWRVLIALHGSEEAAGEGALRQTLEALQRVDPGSPLLRRLAMRRDMARGQLDAVVEGATALYERDPMDEEGLATLFGAWTRQDRADEAEAWFTERLAESPSNPRLLDAVASTLTQRGRGEEAVAWLERRLAEDPRDVASEWLLELTHRRLGRPTEAAALARPRILRRPEGVRRSIDLARLEAEAGNAAEALAALEQVREQIERERPTTDQLLAAMAVCGALGPDDRAANELMRAFADRYVALEPAAPLAVHAAALGAAVRLGDPAEALEERLRTALRSPAGQSGSPAAAAEWLSLAQRLVDAHRPDLAAQALRLRLRHEPRLEMAAMDMLANAALTADVAARDPSATQALLEELVARRSETGWPPLPELREGGDPVAEALFWVSGRWSLLGEPDGAEALLRAAIARDPEHGMALNNLGYLLLERDGVTEESAGAIERAHELLPDSPSVVDSLGWLRCLQGALEDEQGRPGAVTLLRRAAAASEGDPSAEVMDHLGDALWRAGQREEAIEAWRRAVQIVEGTAPPGLMLPTLASYQQRDLYLTVRDPRELYEELFGGVLGRARDKLSRAEQGLAPIAGLP